MLLEKTTRLNLLYDFYQDLLTEKQRQYMELYFQDNYSFGEIAEAFGISRQAVYEHIKRAEQSLEEYEEKLQLLAKYQQRKVILDEIQLILKQRQDKTCNEIQAKIELLRQID
ncbi:putative DNA-binding protein [Tepidibacillus sp. LV47]|uniref:putative DNA-binding protein n=1 Tax=Tepidibacillus sp. LV47 TaxID=3398228 RepID=UPI003AAB574F